jgi:hypothetical protein
MDADSYVEGKNPDILMIVVIKEVMVIVMVKKGMMTVVVKEGMMIVGIKQKDDDSCA